MEEMMQQGRVRASDEHSELAAGGGELVVIFLGYEQREHWVPDVKDAIREALKGQDRVADFLVLRASRFLFANPNAVVADMLKLVEDWWWRRKREGKPSKHVILIGYSLGGVLARKFYIAACGETSRAPLEPEFTRREGYHWAPEVDRIVLLAGMNRGWQISYHMSLSRASVWWMLTRVGTLFAWLGLPPLIFSVRRGAQFLTQMRIQWIRMRQEAKKRGVGHAATIQLLGSVDDLVAPEDNIDLIAGIDFYYLDVPKSSHLSIVEINKTTEGQSRREKLIQALTYTQAELDNISLFPQDDPPQPPDPKKRDVIFVIHGIRDKGYWTSKIGRKVLERARVQRKQGGGNRDIAIRLLSDAAVPVPRQTAREGRVVHGTLCRGGRALSQRHLPFFRSQ